MHLPRPRRPRKPLLWCPQCGTQSVFVTSTCRFCSEYEQGYLSMSTCKRCAHTTYSRLTPKEVYRNV